MATVAESELPELELSDAPAPPAPPAPPAFFVEAVLDALKVEAESVLAAASSAVFADVTDVAGRLTETLLKLIMEITLEVELRPIMRATFGNILKHFQSGC